MKHKLTRENLELHKIQKEFAESLFSGERTFVFVRDDIFITTEEGGFIVTGLEAHREYYFRAGLRRFPLLEIEFVRDYYSRKLFEFINMEKNAFEGSRNESQAKEQYKRSQIRWVREKIRELSYLPDVPLFKEQLEACKGYLALLQEKASESEEKH